MTKDKVSKRKIQQFHTRLGKTISRYNLIEEGDRILIGVSGGKDSISLLNCLTTRRNIVRQKYEIIAVHINIEDVPYEIDKEYVSKFCEENDVKFIIDSIHIGIEEQNTKKSNCFVCSWHRRKRLFELATEYKCNKLALGHHLDDAVETLFMNMFYHGTMSSIPGSLNMFNGKLQIIRPFIEFTDEYIRNFATIMGFPTEKEKCPFENATKRKKTRELMDLIEQDFKPARKNIFKAMSKIYPEYLPRESGKDAIIHGLNIGNSKLD